MLMPLKCANFGDILNYFAIFLCFPTYDNATLAITCGKCNTVQQSKYFLHDSQYSLKEQKWHDTYSTLRGMASVIGCCPI